MSFFDYNLTIMENFKNDMTALAAFGAITVIVILIDKIKKKTEEKLFYCYIIAVNVLIIFMLLYPSIKMTIHR